MAVHRPSTTSMSASRFNLRPIGFPSRFSGGGSSRRSSIASPGGNEGGGAMRQTSRGSQHNLLTAQLNLGSTAASSAAVPTISVNEPLSQYNGVEDQYMQNVDQERLVDENEL
uniref:Uncharacterized protein n=1 Tax=Ditylenchus dipsaci TaxID=166011 RepID=A0A915EP98_9BILA